jgi:nucleoside phosphorylase
LDIHFGRIASGDTVMKSGEDRDSIAQRESVIAFEMEGASVLGNLPCIIVKGVCDYADSHKDKTWQNYAAGSAAACMKALLEQWAVTDYSSSDVIDGLS